MTRGSVPPADPIDVFFCYDGMEEVWGDALQRVCPRIRLHVWPEWEPKNGAEYALVWKPVPGSLAEHLSLKIIPSLGAGVDKPLMDPTVTRRPGCSNGERNAVSRHGRVRSAHGTRRTPEPVRSSGKPAPSNVVDWSVGY